MLTFDDLKIYPNPSDDILYIELNTEEYMDLYFELFDGIGRKLMIKEFSQVNRIFEPIDVSNIPEGVFYIKVRSGNRATVNKIVIQ